MPQSFNYSPKEYTDAASEWAREMYGRGTEGYKWATDQFNKNSAVSDDVTQRALKNATMFDDAAAAGVSRYESLYAPAMAEQLKYAREYTTPEKMKLARGRAMAGVGQAFDAQAKAAAESLEGYDLDPKTVAARLDSSVRTQRAAAEAGAGETSDMNRDLVGQQLLGQAINTGQTDAGVTNAFGAQGANNRNQAVNTGIATTASGSATRGTPMQWAGLGADELKEWPKTEQASYGMSNDFYKASDASQQGWAKIANDSSSGVGALIGAGLGTAARLAPLAFSGGVVPAMQGGGVTPPVTGAINTGGGDGTIVPPGAGVPGIPGQDNVPALVAEGEGVIPLDVMQWRGEAWFQKEIAKARAERQKQTVTQPQDAPPQAVNVAAQAGPQFMSEGAR